MDRKKLLKRISAGVRLDTPPPKRETPRTVYTRKTKHKRPRDGSFVFWFRGRAGAYSPEARERRGGHPCPMSWISGREGKTLDMDWGMAVSGKSRQELSPKIRPASQPDGKPVGNPRTARLRHSSQSRTPSFGHTGLLRST